MAKRKSSKNSSPGSSSEFETTPVKMSKPSLPFNWQSTKSKLTEKLGLIFNTEHYADIHFIVGYEKRKIPAHKFVLLVGSPVFDANFSERWTTEKEFEIKDVEPDAFLALLEFLYTDSTVVTADTVMAVWYAARKYDVPPLENICVRFLMQNLDPSNVFTVLNQAKLFDAPDLITACEETIDKNAKDVLETEEFTKIDFSTLCSILKRDTLVIPELDLLQGSLRWSEAECKRKALAINSENKLSALKDALYLIRFPRMTLDQFSSVVPGTGLLPNKDLEAMFQYFTHKKPPPSYFNVLPRTMAYSVVNRFADISDSLYPCDGKESTLLLKANYDCKLVGIGMYGSPEGVASYAVNLTVVERLSWALIFDDELPPTCTWECATTSCHLNKAKSIFRLFLTKPKKLTQHVIYKLIFSIKGPDSFYGENGKSYTLMKHPTAFGEIEIDFAPDECCCYESTYRRGQLPELLFAR